jgi:hypothetical protein
MWGWLERWQQRQRELKHGVDADLVRDNRRRWKLSWCLLGCCFALIGIQAVLKPSGPWDRVAEVLTAVCFIGGLVLGRWARAEESFLERPNSKEPPSLSK